MTDEFGAGMTAHITGNHVLSSIPGDLTVDAAQTYFIKYDEENKISRSEHTGPWMVMPDKVARQEIAFTRLKSSSYNFVAQDESGRVRSKPQELKPVKYDEKSEVLLVKPFKIWNPLTW